MKIRSALFALAALTTLSVSALAPTQASAWGMRGGYGGGFGGSHHFGGYNRMGYFHPSYRPRFWGGVQSQPAYSPYATYQGPAYQPNYIPQASYVAEPQEAPCSEAASAPPVYAPAPQQQVYVPQQQYAAPYGGTSTIPYQDRKPADYSSPELQR